MLQYFRHNEPCVILEERDTRVTESRAEVSGSHQGRGGEGLGHHSSPYTFTHAAWMSDTGYTLPTQGINTWSKTNRKNTPGSRHKPSTPNIAYTSNETANKQRETPQSWGQQLSNLMGRRCNSQETALSGQHPRKAALFPPSPPVQSPPKKNLNESRSEAQGWDDADFLANVGGSKLQQH